MWIIPVYVVTALELFAVVVVRFALSLLGWLKALAIAAVSGLLACFILLDFGLPQIYALSVSSILSLSVLVRIAQ